MGTFGENLRREREMRGVTLEEICDATKISVRTLQAMESDQFDKLPGGIFTRSFIRSYAKYLGLDDEKIMAEFQLVAPPSAQQTDLRRVSQQRTLPPEERSHAGLATVLVAILILVGGFAYYRFAARPQKAPPEPVAQQAPVQSQPATQGAAPASAESRPEPPNPGGTAEGPATGSPGVASGAPAVSASTAGAPAPVAPAPQEGLNLQVAATEETWVAVSADGKSAFQRTMQPNDIETVHAKNSFDVLTGNAEGIILTLNGKTLDPLGRRGETKKVHLTLGTIQNSNP